MLWSTNLFVDKNRNSQFSQGLQLLNSRVECVWYILFLIWYFLRKGYSGEPGVKFSKYLCWKVRAIDWFLIYFMTQKETDTTPIFFYEIIYHYKETSSLMWRKNQQLTCSKSRRHHRICLIFLDKYYFVQVKKYREIFWKLKNSYFLNAYKYWFSNISRTKKNF